MRILRDMGYNIGTLSIDRISFYKLNKGISSLTPTRFCLSLAAIGVRLFVSLRFTMNKDPKRRSYHYRKHWDELIAMHGKTCFYCRDQIATSIDHIVPFSWDNDNDISNLVPACLFCNALAGNKHFEDIEHKRQYILSRRKYKRSRRAICTDCLLPYVYRNHSPSLFLCAECYDEEYETEMAARGEWRKWLSQLREAMIEPNAHRYAKRHVNPQKKKVGKKKFINKMLEYYDQLEEMTISGADVDTNSTCFPS